MKTIKVDSTHRVRLPNLKPGDYYHAEPADASGQCLVLRRLEPKKMENARFIEFEWHAKGEADAAVIVKANALGTLVCVEFSPDEFDRLIEHARLVKDGKPVSKIYAGQ